MYYSCVRVPVKKLDLNGSMIANLAKHVKLRPILVDVVQVGPSLAEIDRIRSEIG